MTATVYLGTSEFAAVLLHALAETPHRPVLVISRPDAPRGRGRKLAPPPVIEAARELGLASIQPESVNAPEVLEQIRATGAEAVCVCAFGALIKEPLLSAYELLNVHPSLLPRWRGAAPLERAIIAGDDYTGVSIMRLGAGFDSGPVCMQERVAIGPDETYGTLAPKLESLGAELLLRALDAPRLDWRDQDESAVTYAEKIAAADRLLDPVTETATQLARRVRALTPHIGASLELADGTRLGVRAARVCDGGEGPLYVPCREGTLELLRVQPPGKREMDAVDWARGLR